MYDENGNVIKTISWNTLDSSTKFYTESEFNENGQTIAEKDETGESVTEYEYIDETNVVNSVRYANGSKLAYGRNPYNFEITSVTQSTESGVGNTTDITYEHGLPVEVKSGNTVINYEYNDYKRRKTAVYLNGELYESYSYSDGSSANAVTAYNIIRDVYTTITDKQGNVLSITYNNATLVTCEYDIKGKLISRSDKATRADENYTYDRYDNLTSYTCGGNKIDYTYNAYGQVIEKKIGGYAAHTYNYGYKDNAAKSLDYIAFGSYKFKPLTDVNGRNTGKEIFNGENKVAGEYISYRKVGDHATNMPSAVWYANGTEINDNIMYTYDKCGNISEVRENGALIARYAYDSLNRLIREDNKKLNKTYLFDYDSNGNIISKREFAFTLRSTEQLEELESTDNTYSYDGDRFVSYNGELCEYNGLGSPTKYRGKPTTWRCGKVLLSYNGTSFTYDALGRRTGKGNIQFVYDNDGNLIRQSNGLEFIYDNSGVTGFKYNSTQYFYRKDVQGNITAILDSTGNIVVRYNYDAWGNYSITGNEQLGDLNPFRYRGYYYDSETGLYFLQTRYYDPIIGRFISQDSIEYADPETINGLNLYAYCNNNPVMGYDPEGTLNWWQKFLIGLGVIAFLAIATVVTAGIAGVGIGAAFGAGFAGAAIGAGASGLAVTIAAGAFAGSVIWAGLGLVFGAIGGLSTGTWKGVLEGAANGFMVGAISGAIFGGVRSGINYARTTPLIRSVSSEELNSIKSTGSFSSNGSMESKWFATNKADATKWAEWFKQSDFVGIRVPKSSLNNLSVLYKPMLDSIGKAYCIEIDYLNSIIRSLWFF